MSLQQKQFQTLIPLGSELSYFELNFRGSDLRSVINVGWHNEGVQLTLQEKIVLTQEQAYELAENWVQAWNSHELDEIMSHYEEDVVLISPIAARILGDPSGTVKGREAVREYFKKGLEVYPDLKFELIDVMWGLFSVVLYYVNQRGTKAGEFMEVGSTGKITKVVANYNG